MRISRWVFINGGTSPLTKCCSGSKSHPRNHKYCLPQAGQYTKCRVIKPMRPTIKNSATRKVTEFFVFKLYLAVISGIIFIAGVVETIQREMMMAPPNPTRWRMELMEKDPQWNRIVTIIFAIVILSATILGISFVFIMKK